MLVRVWLCTGLVNTLALLNLENLNLFNSWQSFTQVTQGWLKGYYKLLLQECRDIHTHARGAHTQTAHTDTLVTQCLVSTTTLSTTTLEGNFSNILSIIRRSKLNNGYTNKKIM